MPRRAIHTIVVILLLSTSGTTFARDASYSILYTFDDRHIKLAVRHAETALERYILYIRKSHGTQHRTMNYGHRFRNITFAELVRIDRKTQSWLITVSGCRTCCVYICCARHRVSYRSQVVCVYNCNMRGINSPPRSISNLLTTHVQQRSDTCWLFAATIHRASACVCISKVCCARLCLYIWWWWRK